MYGGIVPTVFKLSQLVSTRNTMTGKEIATFVVVTLAIACMGVMSLCWWCNGTGNRVTESIDSPLYLARDRRNDERMPNFLSTVYSSACACACALPTRAPSLSHPPRGGQSGPSSTRPAGPPRPATAPAAAPPSPLRALDPFATTFYW